MSYEALKKLALSATTGPWIAYVGQHAQAIFNSKGCQAAGCGTIVNWSGFDSSDTSLAERKANTRFIAAANPAAVLSLIADADHLSTENEQLKSAISDPEQVFINMKRGVIAKLSARHIADLSGEVINGEDAQLMEIARLRAELESERARADFAVHEAQRQPVALTQDSIREVFLRNGFTIKEGHDDLKPYVYAAANELLQLQGAALKRQAACTTCQGHGVVTRISGQTPEQYDEFNEDCPDCSGDPVVNQQLTTGEQQAEQGPITYKDDLRSPAELSLAGCRCVRFGEGNPHWPCYIHATQPSVSGLVEALEPFAKVAERFRHRGRKYSDLRRDIAILWSACEREFEITAAHCIAAAEALAAHRKQGGE